MVVLGPLLLLTVATGVNVAYLVLTIIGHNFINVNSNSGEVSEILTSLSLSLTLLTNSVTTC